MASGTSITGRAGKCLHFQVDQVSSNEFRMNFTTTSYRNNKRIWWNIEGNQSGKKLSATWQLSSSPRRIGTFRVITYVHHLMSSSILGPLEHQILTFDAKSYLAMIVCAPDKKFIPKQYFAMIWSRQRTLAEPTLNELKAKISDYISRDDIVDIDNTCSELD